VPAALAAPLTWPLSNLAVIMGLPKGGETVTEVDPVKPFSTFPEHIAGISASWRAMALALFCIYYLHGGDDPNTGYAAYG